MGGLQTGGFFKVAGATLHGPFPGPSVIVETSICVLRNLKRKGRETGFWGLLAEGARWLGFKNDLLKGEELDCNGQHFSRRLNKQKSVRFESWSLQYEICSKVCPKLSEIED